MARYTEADVRKFAGSDYGSLTGYQRRLVRGYNAGLSRSQARGHARVTKGEKPVSVVRPKPQKNTPPKISQRFQRLSNGTRVVNTRSSEQIARSLNQHIKGSKGGKRDRLYFQVWDNNKGKYVNVYYGRQGKTGAHGITVEGFLDKVDAKMSSGEAADLDDAMRQVIAEDSSEGAGVDSPEGEEAPYDFSQVSMYIRPA